MNIKKYNCKECHRNFDLKDFYVQGRMCKKCRSLIHRKKVDGKSGVVLAEWLLLKSCESALNRTRGTSTIKYKGVKCQWDKPAIMRNDLKNKKDFWKNWLRQTEVYEGNDRQLSHRPTLDRIEDKPSKNGHYYIENIQVLSHAENSQKANEVNCKVFLFKDSVFFKEVAFTSICEIMREFHITGYNAKQIKYRDFGMIQNIGDGYSILIQSIDGSLKDSETIKYNMVYRSKTILCDYQTGEERIIRESKSLFYTSGIWINENQEVVL